MNLNLNYCQQAKDIMLDLRNQDVSMNSNIEQELKKLEESEKNLWTSKSILQSQLSQFSSSGDQ